MSLLDALRFCVWRAALLGLAFGGALGAAYGVALISLFSSIVFVGFIAVEGQNDPTAIFGYLWLWLVFGTIAAVWAGFIGATWGLILGLLDGLVLAALTRVFFHPWPTDARGYRAAAALTCGAASMAAFLANWAFRGFPEALPFALGFYGVYPAEAPVPGEGLPIDGSGADVVGVALVVVPSALLLALAGSASAWLVAGRYARKLDEEQD